MNNNFIPNNDRDFKYVMQDTSSYYLGARMTFGEMIVWEDVPFKIKGLVNKTFLPACGEQATFADFFAQIDEKGFDYQIIKQLRVRVKAGYYKEKVKRNGETDRKYFSKIYKIDDYLKLAKEQENLITEEVIFSKLALLAFSL